MTEHFEVLERDGPARRGELRFRDPVLTPAVADDFLVDTGSLWPRDRNTPDGDQTTLTVLPHRGFPGGTDERVQETFAPTYPETEFPSAAVITPATARDHGTDAYVLSTAQELVGHAAAFTNAIIQTRNAIPPDTALMLSGVATPRNVATLVYAGVDLVDTHHAVIRGTQGWYLTPHSQTRLVDLDELQCACPACQKSRDSFTREDCVKHNTATLRAELATVRERIREGRLRDYLEAQARHEEWCTAVFREFDQEWTYLETRTPVFRRSGMTATSEDTLRRVEIRRFADRVASRYRCRFDAPLVLVPCSARKPYSESQSHGQFRGAVEWRGHMVSMTSPIAIVPPELELTYPAQHYDTPVTGRWTETEVDFVASVLGEYLDGQAYSRIIAHVPPEGYQRVIERATQDRDITIEYTVEDHPTTPDSLSNLRTALDGEARYSKRERLQNTVRGIADYQFGAGAGDQLFEGTDVRGQYPKHRVFDDEDQLAALVPEYGVLALTLAGARRWVASDIPTRRVEIGEFVPHGSVLAPGVVAASADIRVGDEVVVEGPEAFGVGRAEMYGREMEASSRGVAVDVRHVEAV